MVNPQNFMSPVGFSMAISRLPNTSFTVQKAELPGLSITPAVTPSPFKRIYHTGDTIEYEDFTFQFIVQENMQNYLEVWTWAVLSVFPEKFEQFKKLSESLEGVYSDITFTINNSTHNPNIRYTFKDCFPTNISGISMDTTESDISYPVASATFKVNGFDIDLV